MRRALLSTCLLAACGGGASAPDARALDAPGPRAFARFDPPAAGAGAAWGAIPYPSELYLDGEGRLALHSLPTGPDPHEPTVEMLHEGLRTLTGAGLRSNVYFPIDLAPGGDLDPATLADAAVLVDLDRSTAGALVTVPGQIWWRDDLGAIVLVPDLGTVLDPGHRYAAYLTSDVRTTGGVPLAADPRFPGPPAALADLLPVDLRDRIVVATTFRTADDVTPTRRMRDVAAAQIPTVTVLETIHGASALAAILGEQDADAIPGGCLDNVRPQPHSHVAALIHGTITLSSFLADTVNTDGFPAYDETGQPIVQGTFPVHFTLSLPKTTADWNALPVILYVHGINRTRQDVVTQIDTAARLGAAMLAIDLPYHGHRARRDPALHDRNNETLGTDTPDGFGDTFGLNPAVDLFHLLASGGIPGYHPRAMGENLRAAAIELTQLVAFVRDGDDAPLEAALAPVAGVPGTFRFRPQVGLITESLGGLIAGVTLAVEPDLAAAYVASPAAGFPAPSLLHSPNYAALFAGAITETLGVADRIDPEIPSRAYRVDPIVMLHGNVIERGDAIAYAPQVTRGTFRGGSGPDLVVAMAWGDVWVSNDTTEAYGRALGLPFADMALPSPPAQPIRYVDLPTQAWPIRGNLPAGRTGAFVVFSPTGHAALRKYVEQRNYQPEYPPLVPLNPPERIFPTQIAQHHELWTELMTTHFAGGGVTLTDPYADADPETGGTSCP
jgi:hypothetical protein